MTVCVWLEQKARQIPEVTVPVSNIGNTLFGFIFKCEQHEMLQSNTFATEQMIEAGNRGQKEAGLNVNNTPKHSAALALKQVLQNISPAARGK